MNLSRVTLERGEQKAVLQGMIHVGPEELYSALQSDVDWATRNGYQVFFEGVRKNPTRKASSPNEREIRKFFTILLELYPAAAQSLGISLQKEKIAYPPNAINADITFAELTKRLDLNGFRCNLILRLFKFIGKKELKEVVQDVFSQKGGLNAVLDKSERWSFSRLFKWLVFRKADPVIIDYRNEVAVKTIRSHSHKQNVFIHYGEKHVPGLVRLLRSDGWVVKETTYTDLAKFF